MIQPDPKKQLLRGAAWTVGTRWIIKLLGFLNTVIMARILLPEDYGIVAMAMLAVGLVQTFIDFSPALILLRKAHVTQDEIDSAWTLRMLQGLAAGILMFLLTPMVIAYFGEPRLEFVLWAIAASTILASVSSIGTVLAQKEFNFLLEFKVQTISKFLGVATTLVFGFWLGDFRALALGIVMGYVAPVILGYVLHPYRPHWNTSKIGEIWSMTKWLMLANIGTFVLRRGDELIAGRIGTTHEFGLYNVGADFGQLPVGEVGPAMLRALLPVLSSIQQNVARTNAAVIKTIAGINCVIWPIGLGFIAVVGPATELVLGAKWLEALPYVGAYALVSVLLTVASPAKTLLTLRGFTRVQSSIVWLEFVVFAAAALVLVPQFHLPGLAGARIAACFFSALAMLWSARQRCGMPFKAALMSIARPMLGALAMSAMVVYLVSQVETNAAKLLAAAPAGALFYITWSLITWHLAGRPEGLESTVVDRLSAEWKKRKKP